MTNKDILITLMAEMSGRNRDEIAGTFPPQLNNPNLNKELTDQEANELLTKLRADKDGIRRWAMEGAGRVLNRTRPHERN